MHQASKGWIPADPRAAPAGGIRPRLLLYVQHQWLFCQYDMIPANLVVASSLRANILRVCTVNQCKTHAPRGTDDRKTAITGEHSKY